MQYAAEGDTHRNSVFEEGWAVRWEEGGTPQLPPGVIEVSIWVGLPQDGICIQALPSQETRRKKGRHFSMSHHSEHQQIKRSAGLTHCCQKRANTLVE